MMLPKRRPELVVSRGGKTGAILNAKRDTGAELSKENLQPQPAQTKPAVSPHPVSEPVVRVESPKEKSVAPANAESGDGLDSGKNSQFSSDYAVEKPGFESFANPMELAEKLGQVGYQCLPFVALQVSLLLKSKSNRIKALLLEGPSGCGKSYFAKSLAKISGAELMCLSCYRGMPTQNLIESPSTLAMANAMVGKLEGQAEKLMNLGILSRAYMRSQEKPVILLIDELDKPDAAIDTFFLGPIQDARIWLESRPPIDANVDNLLLIFTKNFNRVLDDALLRRVHPIKMTYLDSTLERKILSKHCHPQLVSNLVAVADRMRNNSGSYAFERPPAPEELLSAGQYVAQMLEWGIVDFGVVGRNIWATLAKSEHDRAVLEHMLRYHPDFMDPLFPDSKNTPLNEIHARLGRIVLSGIVQDPDTERRDAAWKTMDSY
ncbi:MAG: ATP-binding protein [Oligoflexia bacterium]|nr:ATP-binding protein [Oligoflexia bacterium]